MPAAAQTNCDLAAQQGNFIYGTDFSGLDMISRVIKRTLTGDIQPFQAFASEKELMPFKVLRDMDTDLYISRDIRARAIPRCRLILYAAGPPCQP